MHNVVYSDPLMVPAGRGSRIRNPEVWSMSKRWFLFVLCAVLLANVGTTVAQKPTADHPMPTGTELLNDCKQAMRASEGDTRLTELELVDASHCTGYILGVVDGYAVTEAAE